MKELTNKKFSPDIHLEDCFVSVAVVVKNAEKHIERFLVDTHHYLDERYTDYEIVVIDQGSQDGTREIVDHLLTKVPSIRYLSLTFSVHHDIALAAAIENAIGDFVVLLDILNDPIDTIGQLVEKSRDGSDVVIGVSKQSNSLGYQFVRPFVVPMLNKVGYKLPKNSTGLCCLTRRAVNVVTQNGRFHHQFFVRVSNTGCPTTTFEYNTLETSTKTKKNLVSGFSQAAHILVFNSTKPLRWMSSLGLAGSFVAFVVAMYSVLIRFFKENVVEGWTSMIVFMSAFFMLLFTILAFFGEYLGRLLDDRSEHRDYNIAYELNSSVMLQEERVNVLSESNLENGVNSD